MTISKILTIEQVAELLNVRPSWIYQRTCDGALRGTGRGRRGKRPGSGVKPHPVDSVERIPHFKAGRLLRFDRDEVLAWFERLHRGPESLVNQPGDHFQRSENLSVTSPR
jgi:predicted DNA-binding transcriptional regulator AlpA